MRVFSQRIPSLIREGRLQDAISMSQSAIEQVRPSLDRSPRHTPLFIRFVRHLAEAEKSAAHFEDAENHLLEALEIAEEKSKYVDDYDAAKLRLQFADLFDTQGDEQAAEPHYLKTVEMMEQLDPRPRREIANVYNNLGMIARNRSDFPTAEDYYNKASDLFVELDGADSETLATVQNNLGSLYWAWRHPEMARDQLASALTIRRAKLPPNDPDIAQSACNLAAAYHDLNDLQAAGRCYLYAYKIFCRNVDDDPDSVTVVAENFAQLLREHGKEEMAEKVIRNATRHTERAAARARKGDSDEDDSEDS